MESSLVKKKEKTFQLITACSQGNQRKSDFHVTMEKPTECQECELSRGMERYKRGNHVHHRGNKKWSQQLKINL